MTEQLLTVWMSRAHRWHRRANHLAAALERVLREDAESKDLDPYFGISEEAVEQARAALDEKHP